jgi:hypothetical protein
MLLGMNPLAAFLQHEVFRVWFYFPVIETEEF